VLNIKELEETIALQLDFWMRRICWICSMARPYLGVTIEIQMMASACMYTDRPRFGLHFAVFGRKCPLFGILLVFSVLW
jgi:hypothetical protein